MAFPQVESTSEGSETSIGATKVVTLPTGLSAGELCIIQISSETTAATSYLDTAGWVKAVQGDYDDAFLNGVVAYFYRECDGTEGASIEIKTNRSVYSSWQVWRISGYTGPPEFEYFTDTNVGSPNPPALSPTWGAQDTLWLAFGVFSGRGDTYTFTAGPASYTNLWQTGTTRAVVGSARRELNAATEDPGPFTLSQGRRVGSATGAVQGAATGGVVLPADAGALSLVGQDANLLFDRTLSAGAGALALTGQDAELIYGRQLVLDAEKGTLVIAGQPANLLTLRSVLAEPGALSLVGQDAELIYSRGLVLDAEAGSYIISGQDAGLIASRIFQAESGALSLVGQDAQLSVGLALLAEAGALDITGEDAKLVYDAAINALSGTISLLGQPATLFYDGAVTEDIPGFPWRSYMDGRLQDREIRKFVDLTLQSVVYSAYGGMRSVGTTGSYSLGSGWTKFTDFNANTFATPRNVTTDLPNNRISFDLQASYLVTVTFTMSHNESNQGRETNIRLFNETRGTPGQSGPIFIGRNQPGTNFTVVFGVDITPVVAGDFWSFELGNGSSVTGTFEAFQINVQSISPPREQL